MLNKKLERIIIGGVIAILVGATFFPAVSGHIQMNSPNKSYELPTEEEKAKIVTSIYGLNGIKKITNEVSIEKAEEITKDLEELKDAIKNNDEISALKLASKLRKGGVFQNDKIFDLIRNKFKRNALPILKDKDLTNNFTNLMCFILGFGSLGGFLYPIDLIVAISSVIILLPLLLQGGLIIALIITGICILISHSIPFRFALPVAGFVIDKGELITAGLNGTKIIKPENNESARGFILGFVGIVINIFLPLGEEAVIAPFFCIGYSLGITSEIHEK